MRRVGIYGVCCPPAIAIGLAVFFLLVLITRYVSVGSIAAAVTVVSLSLVFYPKDGNFALCAVLSILMGTLVIMKHKENIVRLARHQESKFSIKKRS